MHCFVCLCTESGSNDRRPEKSFSAVLFREVISQGVFFGGILADGLAFLVAVEEEPTLPRVREQ